MKSPSYIRKLRFRDFLASVTLIDPAVLVKFQVRCPRTVARLSERHLGATVS